MINRLDPNFSDSPGRRTIPRNYKRDTVVCCEHIDVSIITPYYNTGDLFIETFVSLQAQSLQNWEWIIVDDGSSDHESVMRLNDIAKKDQRIKVIHQLNGGTSAARNTGFHNSSGRFICLLDHDDMVEPTYLEKCAWFLDSNQEFAFCNSYSVIFGEQNFLWTTGYERGKAFLQANSGPPISVVRRTAYADCGGFDESIRVLYEDWDFWLALAKAGHWGYTIPEYLQWYRKLGSGCYEQMLESGYDNNEFSRVIQQKYAGLDKHFPEPFRRHPQPYETIETKSLVINPLGENSFGRRIMFIVPWMVTGGADRVNLDLIEGLTGKGHDITVCATLLADHCWEHEFSRFTPDIFILPNILNPLDYPRFLAYLIQSRQIDTVVITGSTIGYQLLPYLRAVSTGVAFVDLCRVEEPHWLNGGHPRFGVGYQDVIDLNIVTTQHLADWMQERGADGKRIRTMYTGVSSSVQATQLAKMRRQMLAELNIPDNVPVIVFAARICEQKRPTMLVEILKKARDHGLVFRALIIGDGEQRAQLEALLSQYHLTTHVQMLGSVSHQRWLDILVVSDILLMPSQYEGISIALLEAMAAGVVPVVAEVGGQNEIVSSDAGVLIPHGANEIDDYFDAICRLLSNTAELQKMSKQCKSIAASKLSWEGMIDNFLAFLDEAHQLRVEYPRYPISPNFGRELVSLSMREGPAINTDQTVIACDEEINAYRLKIEQFDVQLRHATTQIANLNHALTIRDQEVSALRNSTSWRVTKPLRFFSHRLKERLKSSYRRPVIGPEKLPEGFDKEAYLYLNPDLANAGIDPAIHYLLRGSRESRAFSIPALDICGEHNFKPERKTILIVSHEASLTGAPILSVNLVQILVESYNVVALLLGGGPLSDAFRLSGAAVITSANLRENPILAHLLVSQLCERFNFMFAIVNSIESRVVLSALGEYFVPAISLVHEFASYTRPRGAFRDTLFWSGEVVFSANVTMENAFVEYPELVNRFVHILPQGRSLLPLSEFTEEQRQAESMHIRRLMRPKGLAEDTVIVLGAGFVHIRKGVDLFIECAARVHCAPGGERCRFVWIGNGYDPDNDVGYSVYLADQIRRAGLQEHVFFIAETTAIETAYEEADLLLLSSRLDPLPNVAIDAMWHGLPVLCFNKTTGIADFLIESGLGNYCVAEYIDSTNMAEKILALASSKVLREDVGEQCRLASIEYFNMKKYVARLDVLAQGICERTQQERADTKTILDSGLFRRDFSCSPYQQNQSIEDEVRFYVRAWASGINRRKPLPGFHPGIYQEQHGLAIQGADPFADYLRAGQPEGTWNYPVIVAQKAASDKLPDNHRVALHLHIYYPELLPEIITRLAFNRICPDLFISITNETARQWVNSQLSKYKGKVIDIKLLPNRGRNIGPFLTAFSQRLFANYDFVGHIHTKKTVDVKDASMGEAWRQFLLENLLGGELAPMADTILARMNEDGSIGMVFPDDPYIAGWGANLAFAEPLATRMGLEKLPEHFVFPVGSMFWARTSALSPLLDLNLSWDDYPEEPLPYDGSSLHALERLFSLILSLNNLRSAATNVMGLTR